MNIKDVTLSKLAVANYIFDSLTFYNKSLLKFRNSLDGVIDLNQERHRKALLDWLNDWGCRNLDVDQHPIALKSINEWYQKFDNVLPYNKPLWRMEDNDIEIAATAYGSLKNEIGSIRHRSGKEIKVHIGPTAASKILFVLLPEAMTPWDDAMRKKLGYSAGSRAYASYQHMIRDLTLHLESLCRRNNFDIDELPEKTGRRYSTVLELVNAYIWITVTREIELPSPEILTHWVSLG
jgi:hypothetical protein